MYPFLVRYFVFIGLLSIAWGESTSPAYTEISRKVVALKDHKVTLIRIRPPALPKAPPSSAPVVRALSAEEQATMERYEKKAYADLNVQATVYLGGKTPVTELRWRNETGEVQYRAWSNVNFLYLTQLTQIETETTVYSWFPFIDSWDLTDWPADQKYPIPAGLNLSRTEAEYFIDPRTKELKDQETTLAGLDYLHAYYQIHYKELKADYETCETENAAREKALREHPPVKPDTVTYFWPIQSRRNPR